MARFTKVVCWILLAAFAFGMTVGFCSISRCQEPSIEAAKARMREIEQQKQAEKELADAKAAAELQQQAEIVEQLPEPVPEPTIQFSKPVQTSAGQRLPRAVLVCGQFCSPCIRMENELAALTGGSEAPIQVVKNWLANDLDEWGITPGMQLGTPYLFILDKEGKVHSLSPAGGLGCVLRGYQNRETVLAYLAQPEHGVDVMPVDQLPVIAEVTNAEANPQTLAAVLAAHLVESSGQEPEEQINYGSLFSFEVDVSDTWKQIGSNILKAQTIDFPSAGLTLDWTGAKRTFAISATSIEITPSIKATVNKWLITYSCGLDGFEFEPDLSSVTVRLSGAPDLTVRLK